MGNNKLYASLKKSGDDFTFKELSTSSNNSDGLVHIFVNDMSPTNITTVTTRCFDKVFGLLEDKDCLKLYATQFRYNNIRMGNSLATWLLSLGIYPIYGAFPISKDNTFDYDAYNKAVESAAQKNKDTREFMLFKLDEGVEYCNQLAKKAGDYSENVFKQQYNDAISKYDESKQRIKLVAKVDDKSGFYNNKIDLFEKIHIRKNVLESLPKHEYNYKFALKTTPDEFTSEIELKKSECKQKYDKDIFNIDKEASANGLILKNKSSSLKLNFPEYIQKNNFNIRVRAPEDINISDKNINEVPINFTIESKDFYNVFPQYANADSNIRLTFDGSDITVVNKTKYFVQIKSISIYYNNVIYDYASNDIKSAFELSPDAKIDISNIIKSINSKLIKESTKLSMTADKAKSTNIDFGFAVKYRVVEQSVDKTLYETKKYNLFNILKNI